MRVLKIITIFLTIALLSLATSMLVQAQRGDRQRGSGGRGAKDPGVRADAVDAGQPLPNLDQTYGASEYFMNGFGRFQEVESVQNGTNNGLGPRFNENQCSSCHAQPNIGGSSPSATAYPFLGPNPQTQVYNLNGARNTLPSFITPDGPVREARFVNLLNPNGTVNNNAPDGGVHDLFVISGRTDAGNCNIQQPNFRGAVEQGNVIFRIPTPVFGAGLMENISDQTILANMNSNVHANQMLGVTGHPNHNGNDGTISRFGWKAQNKSLEIFAGEAYNVEMGVTNELFPSERPSPDEEQQGGLPASCLLNPTPEDSTNFSPTSSGGDSASQYAQIPSDVVQFAMFMRLLAPPTPSVTGIPGNPPPQSIANGRQNFNNVGCNSCHTPTLTTAQSSIPSLSQVQANLFSDLLVHHMGNNLADGVSQGSAGPDEFRSAPLWGVGQRIFFLHDGRTTDLVDAIEEHASQGSEANEVIENFNGLSREQQQDLLNFLRSL
jgi:CxxC motif-containing protein (DUF1111 family)